ncbi:LysR family transcriptional regulator [Nocardia sp. NPDC059239]|uniref:LysR family transcriptional regulator n=1 Tax=unclassified Nocardia TaxID=2637762 RepID=UPI00369CD68F
MTTDIEMRHLRAFATTAEQLHFTRAAACLHMTQQALSTQIRILEKQLGVKLFERTTRKVELTTAGGILYRRVQGLMDQLDNAVEEARRSAVADHGIRGPVTLQHRRPASNRFPWAQIPEDGRETAAGRKFAAPVGQPSTSNR